MNHFDPQAFLLELKKYPEHSWTRRMDGLSVQELLQVMDVLASRIAADLRARNRALEEHLARRAEGYEALEDMGLAGELDVEAEAAGASSAESIVKDLLARLGVGSPGAPQEGSGR